MDEITVINNRNNDNSKDDYDDEDDNKTLRDVIEIFFELKREFHPNYIPPHILLQPRLRSKHNSTCLF